MCCILNTTHTINTNSLGLPLHLGITIMIGTVPLLISYGAQGPGPSRLVHFLPQSYKFPFSLVLSRSVCSYTVFLQSQLFPLLYFFYPVIGLTRLL